MSFENIPSVLLHTHPSFLFVRSSSWAAVSLPQHCALHRTTPVDGCPGSAFHIQCIHPSQTVLRSSEKPMHLRKTVISIFLPAGDIPFAREQLESDDKYVVNIFLFWIFFCSSQFLLPSLLALFFLFFSEREKGKMFRIHPFLSLSQGRLLEGRGEEGKAEE